MGSTRDFVNYVYPGIKGIKGKFKKKSIKKKKKITLLRRRKHAYYDLMSLKKKKKKSRLTQSLHLSAHMTGAGK